MLAVAMGLAVVTKGLAEPMYRPAAPPAQAWVACLPELLGDSMTLLWLPA